jgi:hypothetical protein
MIVLDTHALVWWASGSTQHLSSKALRAIEKAQRSGEIIVSSISSCDNELLDRHFIVGDGRANENIVLTAVHTVFHSEHNHRRLLKLPSTVRRPRGSSCGLVCVAPSAAPATSVSRSSPAA